MANRGCLSEPSGSLADANIISVDKNLARDTVRTPVFLILLRKRPGLFSVRSIFLFVSVMCAALRYFKLAVLVDSVYQTVFFVDMSAPVA